jgi:2-polyprenyl-3-methyl-5-hydroxy-6-metoxy-1,4-benzoquinol methylase
MEYSIKSEVTYGFKRLDPIPSKSALAEFYAGQYYPKEPLALTDTEKKYIRYEAQLALLTIKGKNSLPSLLDLGCGPGFFSRQFMLLGWQVKTCDYARAALEANTPELMPHFIECDIEQYAETSEDNMAL